MTLDPVLLDRMTTAWIQTQRWTNARKKRTGSKATYDGPSADEVLAAAGITFDGTRSLYHAYERAARRRLYEMLGPKLAPGGRGLRKSHAVQRRGSPGRGAA